MWERWAVAICGILFAGSGIRLILGANEFYRTLRDERIRRMGHDFPAHEPGRYRTIGTLLLILGALLTLIAIYSPAG